MALHVVMVVSVDVDNVVVVVVEVGVMWSMN